MSFKKSMIGSKGEPCEYHTITKVEADYSMLPDANGEGASMSTVRLSTFVSREFYVQNNGDARLAVFHKFYAIDLVTIGTALRVPDGVKSAEQKAYEQILLQDEFFSDAEVVE